MIKSFGIEYGFLDVPYEGCECFYKITDLETYKKEFINICKSLFHDIYLKEIELIYDKYGNISIDYVEELLLCEFTKYDKIAIGKDTISKIISFYRKRNIEKILLM